MRLKITVGVVVVIGMGIWLSLWGAPVSMWDLLAQPVRSLWGSPEQLQTSILEVSENISPVEAATRRLLQPLGVVRVIKHFPAPPASENTSTDNNAASPH